MAAVTLKGPRGWTLVLDKDETRYEGGTPTMVYSPKEKQWASYGCATDTGEVTGIDGSVKAIPADVLTWLEEQEEQVEALYTEN